jgi:hypothetical protein
LGDTVLFSILVPNRDDGFILGFGPTIIFPTATEDLLGQDKWQAGPAALAVWLGTQHVGWVLDHFNIGLLAQHWWDVAGDDDRPHTNQYDIQYSNYWRMNPIQLVRMTPNIQIDWKKGCSDRLSVPIVLGPIGFFSAWGKYRSAAALNSSIT